MDVASEHFVRFGFRRARIGDIAQESGIGKGTPYLYFASKKPLLYACVIREKRVLIPEIKALFERPPEQQMEAYLRLTLRFAFTAPLTRALLQKESDLKVIMSDLDDDGSITKGRALICFFLAPIAPGLSEARLETVSSLVQALVMSTAHIDLAFFSLSLDDFIDSLVPVLTRGIAALEAG